MKKKQSKSGPSVPETNRGRDRVSFMISSSIGMMKQLQCRRSKSCNSESKRFAIGDQSMQFRSQKLHCGTLRLGSSKCSSVGINSETTTSLKKLIFFFTDHAFSCGETDII